MVPRGARASAAALQDEYRVASVQRPGCLWPPPRVCQGVVSWTLRAARDTLHLMAKVDPLAVDRLLAHNTVEVIDRAHLRARLQRGEKLRVKLGMDPTAPDLHLGHAVILRKLRAFQDLGHIAVLIVGDATARIGDPSGRSKVRPPLSDRAIATNAKTYFTQAGKVLRLSTAEVRRNSEWLDALKFVDLLRLLGKFTVARVLEREDVAARMKQGTPVGLHELLYPILQAYDSVAVKADVELGGTDQTFNLLAGRDLQPSFQQPAQDILTTKLLVGLDGKDKMSKSLGNTVGITELPDSMVGKLMTIPDSALSDYARFAAEWSDAQGDALARRVKKENPRDIKLEIARDVVAQFHGAAAAQKATAEWLRVFHQKELPKKIPRSTLRAGAWNVDALLVTAGLVSSKSEAKRVHAQGGVRLNEIRVDSDVKDLTIKSGDLLQVGRRKFVRIR